eukprot:2000827-Pyramimonas_sp.AAC.1
MLAPNRRQGLQGVMIHTAHSPRISYWRLRPSNQRLRRFVASSIFSNGLSNPLIVYVPAHPTGLQRHKRIMVVPVLHPTGGPCAGGPLRRPLPLPGADPHGHGRLPRVHGVSLWRNTRAHHWSTGLWVYGSTSLRVYGSAGLRVYGHARPTSRPKLSIVAGTLTSMRALKQMKVTLAG